jgi:hypothetical protein
MRAFARFRVAAATVVAVTSILAIAGSPAAAETVLVGCSGTCGSWQVRDDSSTQDIVCVELNKGPHELYEITVRPPKIYGPYAAATKVDWRFQVQEKSFNSPSHWKTISTSPYQTANASTTAAASSGHGFSTAVWPFIHIGPGSPAEGYRALVEMDWWHTSSVAGRVQIKYDWYSIVRRNGTITGTASRCSGAESD